MLGTLVELHLSGERTQAKTRVDAFCEAFASSREREACVELQAYYTGGRVDR